MSNYWQPLLRSGPPSSQTAATYGDLEQYLPLEGGNMRGTTTFGRNTLHVSPTGPVGDVSGVSFFEFSSGSSSEVSGGVIFAPDNTTQGDLLITSPWFLEPSAAVNHHVRSYIQLFSSPSDDSSGAYIAYGANSHTWTIQTAPDTPALDTMKLDTSGLHLDAANSYALLPRKDDTDTYITSDNADEIQAYAGGVLLQEWVEGANDYAHFPEFLALGDTGASGLTGFQASGQDDQIEVHVDGTERVRVGKTLMTVGQGSTVDLEVEGTLRTGMGATLTIASGSITPTHSYHRVNTESAASSDDLDTITAGSEGDILVLRIGTAGDSVVCKDGTGNLALNGDFTMNALVDSITLMYFAEGIGLWTELSRGNNA